MLLQPRLIISCYFPVILVLLYALKALQHTAISIACYFRVRVHIELITTDESIACYVKFAPGELLSCIRTERMKSYDLRCVDFI